MITKVDETAALLERSIRDECEVAVIGVTGGIDSAVTACICSAALGARNVFLVSSIDPEQDKGTSSARIRKLVELTGAVHLVVPLEEQTEGLLKSTRERLDDVLNLTVEPDKRARRKMTARLSSTVLYAISNQLREHFESQAAEPGQLRSAVTARAIKRVRVVGSINAAEILLGYSIKAGDAVADIMALGDLFKSEIYQLAKHYQIPELIIKAAPAKPKLEAVPKPEPTQNVRHIRSVKKGESPRSDLPYSYEELEPALSALYRALFSGIQEGELSTELSEFQTVDSKLAQFVIDRFRSNTHKHGPSQVIALRNTPFVKDIWAV